MKYLVAGNYAKFAVTLTQKSGELIVPYIPTEGDVVQISLYGARRFDYPNYEQVQNVLTFEDNGCLNVGLYCLEVKITEANTHKLRCMYREQIRVVASNDDVPTDASFADDDVQLNGQFDIVASVEIVVDDELSLTSTNPVQNKVVTAVINDKADEIDVYEDLEDGVYVYRVDLLSHFGEETTIISSSILPYATQGLGGLMSATDKTKLDALPTNSDLQTALNAKGGTLAGDMTAAGYEIDLKSGNTSLSQVYIPFATAQIDGLMSAGDYSKLAALPTNAELTTALNGKEDKVSIEAPVNSVDETQPITTLTTEIGKYYRIDVAVETLAITLPAMTDSTKIASVVLYLTGGTTPAVTIASTAPSGGTAPDVYYQDGFAIDAGKTYEVNCLYNGVAWVVAAVEIDEV